MPTARRTKMTCTADLDMLIHDAEWPVLAEEEYLARLEIEAAGDLD
jgi:hypothetical protein